MIAECEGKEQEEKEKKKKKKKKAMAALTTVIFAVVGLIVVWAGIELTCRPCLQYGRSALDRSLNPDYDPDDEIDNQHLIRSDEQHNEAEDVIDEKKPSTIGV
ncbi:hypothetical protein O6H91_04G066300 [Diphasiastrum complanatum]|uniref:Uncharacterized protein n=1 Tax=Diphasiastrum complanatum TaxID=34168 RepID=A0ACC2DXL7_DIPCM|nr:hypothetical protein O6H91_04G066300 [Diphasiastrum complanatum]